MAKWGKKRTTGVKFQSKILSSGQNFRLTYLVAHWSKYRIEIFGLRTTLTGCRTCDVCKPPSVPETAFANLTQLAFFISKCRLSQNRKPYLRQIRKHSPWNGWRFACVAPPPTCFSRPMAKNSDSVRSTLDNTYMDC